MLAHIVRRIVATIPVMAIVALFVFSLLYIAPGDPAAVIAGDQASPEDIEKIRIGLGLDRPFLVRFGEWSWSILQADLGTSMFTGLPVTTLIAQRLEPTLSLMVVTLILAVTVAVPMGVIAAWKALAPGVSSATNGKFGAGVRRPSRLGSLGVEATVARLCPR